MSSGSTYQGDALDIMIYGESHSEAIGVYINGLPDDVVPDPARTAAFMARRAPGKNAWSTPRKEADEVIFERNGAMLHGYIMNTNTKPKDYASIINCPRPSHADYAARLLYGDEASKSGGGIFSGRMRPGTAFPCWPSCLPWSFTGGQGSRNKCVRRTVPLSQKERV